MSESGKKTWVYPLTSTSSTKRGRRVFTPYGLAYDMIGVDGSAHGGVRPHYGFKWVTDLTGVADVSGNAAQEVLHFEPVSFRIGPADSGWGFLLWLWDSTTFKMKVVLHYRSGTSTTWNGPTTIKEVAVLEDAETRQYACLVQGRFVYVFIEGEQPAMFYYDPDAMALTIVTDTGPGEPPVLDSFLQTISVEEGQTPQDTTPEGLAVSADALPGIAAPPTGDQPGKSRVYPVAFVGEAPDSRWLSGPTDMNLWTVVPDEMVDPEFDPVTPSVWRGGLGALTGNNVSVTRPPSYYTFAYQLYNSVSGRRSQLSQLTNIAVGNFETGPLAINAQAEAVVWALSELVYDEAKYDTAFFYRSVRAEDNTILHLDGIIDLERFQATDQTGMTGSFKRAYYFYQLTDPVLVAQDTFLGDSLLYDSEMPKAGAALLYDGCALYGKIGEFDTEKGGLGFIRWSNAFDVNPEQVAPANRYPLSNPTEEILNFVRLGPNVMAFSTTTMYHIRKETFIIKMTPTQSDYGGPSYRGVAAVGSECYLVTESGLKLIDSMGGMSNVEVMDDLIQNTWAGEVSSVEVAYEGVTEVVWIFNPIRQTAGLLWLRTSEFTEMVDMNFKHVRSGKVPADWENDNRNFQSRACFLQKVSPDGLSADPEWRVFVPDYRRSKEKRQMLDVNNAQLLFTLVVGGGISELIAPSGFFNKVNGRLEGARVYALDGTQAGFSDVILQVLSTFRVQMEGTNLAGVPAGTRMGISPVNLRWTGHAAGLMSEYGGDDGSEGTQLTPYDYARVRHVESIGCVFCDVSGQPSFDGSGDARFCADVWKGNSNQLDRPVYETFPMDAGGDDVQSVVEGPGLYYTRVTQSGQDGGRQAAALFPTVNIFVPDLEYTLLNVIVVGTVKTAMTEGFVPTNIT